MALGDVGFGSDAGGFVRLASGAMVPRNHPLAIAELGHAAGAPLSAPGQTMDGQPTAPAGMPPAPMAHDALAGMHGASPVDQPGVGPLAGQVDQVTGQMAQPASQPGTLGGFTANVDAMTQQMTLPQAGGGAGGRWGQIQDWGSPSEMQNKAAGYDVGAWNGLPAATQQQYTALGGAPRQPYEQGGFTGGKFGSLSGSMTSAGSAMSAANASLGRPRTTPARAYGSLSSAMMGGSNGYGSNGSNMGRAFKMWGS